MRGGNGGGLVGMVKEEGGPCVKGQGIGRKSRAGRGSSWTGEGRRSKGCDGENFFAIGWAVIYSTSVERCLLFDCI